MISDRLGFASSGKPNAQFYPKRAGRNRGLVKIVVSLEVVTKSIGNLRSRPGPGPNIDVVRQRAAPSRAAASAPGLARELRSRRRARP